MSGQRVIVVGGGMAGLSAAVALAQKGVAVTLYEALGQAGGRCRSYFDAALGMVIDNGSHLVLSGNPAVQSYLRTIGALSALQGPDHARFAFADLKSGARWTIAPNDGPLPWWVLCDSRRVPGTKPLDYARLAPLLTANPALRIKDVIACKGVLWERLLRPLLLAVLNTEPEAASARLAGAVLHETLAKGGLAYRPRIATPNLAAAFVDPALNYLAAKGAEVIFRKRLQRIVLGETRATALEFSDGMMPLGERECLVLATPAWFTRELLPDISTPDDYRAIVNAHFKIAPPEGAEPMLGLVGASAEWIFAFADRISVTVSAAEAIADEDREVLATRLWLDVARAHDISAPMPPWQIVRERRATFAATPEQDARRPGPATRWRNLLLAGDWTATGLPSTIEGALRSGIRAAKLICAQGN